MGRHARARLGLWALAAVVAAAGGPPGVSLGVQSGVLRLQRIDLDPASLALLPGATQAMRAVGVYSDGSTRDLTGAVVFRSREPKVATVDGGGVVTAVAAGRSEISATEPASGVTSRTTARVTVLKLKSLAISPATTVVRAGSQAPVQAIGTYEDGTTGVDLTASVEWSSAKSSVAQPVRNSDGTAAVAGVAPGATNLAVRDPITGVRSSNSSGKVSVVNRLLRVAVAPARKTVRVAERTRFKAIGTFEKDATLDISTDVEWSVGDPAIATADAEGRVRGVSVGSTAVKAMDRVTGVTSSAAAADGVIDVVGDVIALRVTPANVILALGGKSNLKASAYFAEQPKSVNFTTKVEWLSGDPARVSVDRLGAATCLGPGAVVVSARDPVTGVTSTATGGDARVLCGLAVTGIEVVPATLTMGLDKTKKVKAFLVFEEGTRVEVTKQVEWSSTERGIATVEVAEPNIGRVTAIGDGVATIVARDPATGRSSADPGGTSCVVTVQGQPVSIQIEPDPTGRGIINGVAGETLQMKVLAKFVGGSTRGINNLVTWTSSAPEVVSVSNGDDADRPGFARFGVPGTAKVTITYPKIDTPADPRATPLTDTVTVNVR